MANIDKILWKDSVASFLTALNLSDIQRENLLVAREKIRRTLRQSFINAQRELFDGKTISPRFYSQGSFAYKTINQPIYEFKQQMDLDDGVYLPMSLLENTPPDMAHHMFFQVTDTALKELAKKQGWKFNDEKHTCSRVILNNEAHIDVPMYAIPDHKFLQIVEAMAQQKAMNRAGRANFADGSGLPDMRTILNSDEVWLAHRSEGWKQSDPRKITDWFKKEVAVHGEIIRRVCRYLKAWRDYNHPTMDNISSILLMACVDIVFNQNMHAAPANDGEALRMVVRRLPAMFQGDIENPAEPGEKLSDRLASEDRQNMIDLSTNFGNQLDSALEHSHDPHNIISILQKEFGDRIPHRPDLITASTPQEEVYQHPPAVISAAPAVPQTKSG